VPVESPVSVRAVLVDARGLRISLPPEPESASTPSALVGRRADPTIGRSGVAAVYPDTGVLAPVTVATPVLDDDEGDHDARAAEVPHGRPGYLQHVVGVPMEALFPFYRWLVQRPLAAPDHPDFARASTYLAQGLEFGVKVAQLFASVPLDPTVPTPATLLAGYATMLYTLGAAQTHLHDPRSADPTDHLLFVPGTDLAGAFAALPGDVRLFLSTFPLRDFFAAEYRVNNPERMAELYPDGHAEDLLTRAVAGRSYTLGEYLDNALMPGPARAVGQYEAFGVRSPAPTTDDRGSRLRHTSLLVGAVATVIRDHDELRAIVRRVQRWVVATRAATTTNPNPVDLTNVALHLRWQQRDMEGLEGGTTLAVVWSAAVDLVEQLRFRPDRLTLAPLASIVARLPEHERSAAVLTAVEAVHTRIDWPTRAAVVAVETAGLLVDAEALRAVGRWFPRATVVTPDGHLEPVRWVQDSDRFTAVNTAPHRVSIERLLSRLGRLADAAGGMPALIDRVGVTRLPEAVAPDAEQGLRDIAYLAAAVFGPDFTEEQLISVRLLPHAELTGGQPRLTEWDDLERVARDLGIEDGGPLTGPIHMPPLVDALAQAAVDPDRGTDGPVEVISYLRWLIGAEGPYSEPVGALVDILRTDVLLDRLASQAGGLDNLADAVGVASLPTPDREQALRHILALAGSVYGPSATVADLVRTWRLPHADLTGDRTRLTGRADLERLIRDLRGDGDHPHPVDPDQVRSLVDILADADGHGVVDPVGDLRRQVAGVVPPRTELARGLAEVRAGGEPGPAAGRPAVPRPVEDAAGQVSPDAAPPAGHVALLDLIQEGPVEAGHAFLAESDPDRRRDLMLQVLADPRTTATGLHAFAEFAEQAATHPSTRADAAVLRAVARSVASRVPIVPRDLDAHRVHLTGAARFTWINGLDRVARDRPDQERAYHSVARSVAACAGGAGG